MGLLERVKERDTGIGDCTIVDAAGVPYAVMPSILYAGELEVLIDELIEILHHQAAQAGVEYRFGDSIATLEPDDDGVNVSFGHAPPQRFDLVIGADGAHSTVRRLIFGPEEDFTHYLGCYYGYWTVDNRLGLDHEGMATGDGETAALSVFSVKHNRQARAGLLFKADRPLPYGRPTSRHTRAFSRNALPTSAGRPPPCWNSSMPSTTSTSTTMTQIRVDSWADDHQRRNAAVAVSHHDRVCDTEVQLSVTLALVAALRPSSAPGGSGG